MVEKNQLEKPRNQIRIRIILEIVSAFVLLSVLVIWFAYRQQKSSYIQGLIHIGMSHAHYLTKKPSELKESFSEILRNADLYAANPENKKLSEKTQEVERYINLLPESLPIVGQTYLMDGRNVSKDSIPRYHILLGSDRMYSFGITPGVIYEADHIFANTVEEAMTGKIAVSDMYSDEFGDWISILYPLYDENKKQFGLFGIDIQLKEMKEELWTLLVRISMIIGVSFLIMNILVYLRLDSIFKALNQLGLISRELASGNTSQEINYHKRDELGLIYEAIADMVARLKILLDRIRKAGKHMAESGQNFLINATESIELSKNISESVKGLDQVLREQVVSLRESRNAMQEVTVALHRISSVAMGVNQSASLSFEAASKGASQLGTLSENLNLVEKSIQNSGNIASELDQSSDQIGKIVDTITHIATQTNLLALNASIEAARAGEEGKGFAVVADEVSKLAAQSTTSAKQIRGMLDSIRERIRKLVESTQETVESMRQGNATIDEAEENFKEIVEMARSVSDQIADVSSSVEEISASSDEVISSMEQNLAISEQCLKASGEITESSEMQAIAMHQIENKAKKLEEYAENLSQIVSELR
jgi:methyl-accepting chemotaxis protein